MFGWSLLIFMMFLMLSLWVFGFKVVYIFWWYGNWNFCGIILMMVMGLWLKRRDLFMMFGLLL